MIKAIAFDYGGVIETIEGGVVQNVTKYLNIKEEDWRSVYSSLNYLCNTGQKSYEEVYELVAKKLGASDSQIAGAIEIFKKNRDTIEINFKLVELIKKLKSSYKIGLLSNNTIKLRQELTDLNLIDLFDVVVISSEEGYQKPQPEIFEILFKKLGVKSSEVIFVDDSRTSLVGAERIGYTPILFLSNDQLKAELKKFSITL